MRFISISAMVKFSPFEGNMQKRDDLLSILSLIKYFWTCAPVLLNELQTNLFNVKIKFLFRGYPWHTLDHWCHTWIMLESGVSHSEDPAAAACLAYFRCHDGTLLATPMVILISFFLCYFILERYFYFLGLGSSLSASLFPIAAKLPIPTRIFLFSWKGINESRVFVCADQYVVMKAVLPFPAKVSLSWWGRIYFMFYCNQITKIWFHRTVALPFSSSEHIGRDN